MALLDLKVVETRELTSRIRQFTLTAADGRDLPDYTPGAHVGLRLPNGLVRSYSLLDWPRFGPTYRIAVARDPQGRGGSSWIHDHLSVGCRVAAEPPTNRFPLAEEADFSLLIAGGIGITPLWCMVQRLSERRKPWRLLYACRNREAAALLEPLQALARAGGHALDLWFDDEHPGQFVDLHAVIGSAPRSSHLYCCGPSAMLAAFAAATADRPPDHVHVEYFQNAPEAGGGTPLGGFTVHLARSGGSVFVPEGATILDALMMEGIDAPYSCYEGLCGTCETRVLDGLPDHRDRLLTPTAKASNQTIIICCSGSRTPTLTLDL